MLVMLDSLLLMKVAQDMLSLLQLHDLFLDGILHNQLIYLYILRLTDAIGTVSCLILGGKVPPRVIMNDDFCIGQIQAGAACL